MLTSVYLSKHKKISKCSESRIMVFMLFFSGLRLRSLKRGFQILDVDERDDLNSDKDHKCIMKRHFYAD